MRSDSASRAALLAGSPGFRVVRLLGQGTMGAVYEAEDLALGRRVAIKIFPPTLLEYEEFEHRFRREARAMAAVSHPNVTAIHAAGAAWGTVFLVCELVRGGTLRDRLARYGRLPWPEAARIAAGIARGLSAVHAAGLVHRDVKPANVLLDGRGSPKLADFGLVLPLDSGSGDGSGEVLGTPRYLAPEQVHARPCVGPRSDLYGLGGVLYEMLVGEPPFSGNSLEVMHKQLSERPRSPRERVPGVPRHLERLVLSLLEKVPASRPASAASVALELEGLAAPGGFELGRRFKDLLAFASSFAATVAFSLG